MYSKWFDEYHKKFPDRFSSTISRSVPAAAFKQVTAGTVDFGASDGPMNDEQIEGISRQARLQCIWHFPTVLGADVPTYNLPA